MNQPTEEIAFEIVPQSSGLAETSKSAIETSFAGFFQSAARWKKESESITDPKLARVARLELKNIRVAAEKTRKDLKEDSLRTGKAIDGANNILLAMIVPIERSLEDIEKAAERAEIARIQALQDERAAIIEGFGYPAESNLGTLSEALWEARRQQAEDAATARAEREKREREAAEAAARKEAEDREAQRLENIRLRAEAEAAAAAAKAEREAREAAEAKAEAARKAADAKAKAERERAEAAARAERLRLQAIAEKERARAAAAAEKAAAEKAKLEAEAKALRDAEAKRVADAKAAADAKAKAEADAAKKAAAAPDKAKLMHFADVVRHLDVPLANSEAGKNVAAEVAVKCEGFAKWIEAKAATL